MKKYVYGLIIVSFVVNKYGRKFEFAIVVSKNTDNLNVKIKINPSNSAGTSRRPQTQQVEMTALFLHCKKYLIQTTEIKRVRSLRI
jgi:hypothetical protein